MDLKTKISLIVLIIGLVFFLQSPLIFGQNSSTFLTQARNNNYSLGQELYLENCSGCHIPLPAEILPRERWLDILNDSQNHYGVALPTAVKVTSRLMWTYLQTYSRPANPGETLPEYITNSRYLKALHPQVTLPKPTNHQSCTTCHPGAAKLDYRTLSAEWLDGSE